MDTWKNQLYFGDNLDILRRHIPVGSVDLIYLDPPFNSSATYNMLFKEPGGAISGADRSFRGHLEMGGVGPSLP
jgi:hypothetical protein